MASHRVRRPPGRFLGPNGIRYTPMRDLPIVQDEQDLVDRIQAATSIRDEPECIGPAILKSYAEVNARICTQQHVLDVAAAQQTRPELKAEDRLRDIHRRAKYAHVDLSHEIGIMERDLEKARRRGADPKPHTLTRLERLESTLDGIAA
jgi:hypothetical protein